MVKSVTYGINCVTILYIVTGMLHTYFPGLRRNREAWKPWVAQGALAL